MISVIMASGQGSRLWPLSRQAKPKQFHSFLKQNTIIQNTFKRISGFSGVKDIYVVTLDEYSQFVKDQLSKLPPNNIFTEPFATGTLGSIGAALVKLNKISPEETVILLPSDHVIYETDKYKNIVEFAQKVVNKFPGKIITIGINPTSADTGMGYIKMNEEMTKEGELKAFSAQGFVEKPDIETAKKYLSSWQYLWNSGMFVGKVKLFVKLYKTYSPKTWETLSEIGEKNLEGKEAKKLYEQIEKTSIDYAIMEKLKDYIVIPGDFGWSDVGSWGTLLGVLSEHYGSSVISKGNHISVDDQNCLVMGQDKLIATVGMKNTVIVETDDAILICNASEAQKIKELIEKLKKEGKHLYL